MNERADVLVRFESLPWQSPAAGVRFKTFVRGTQQVRLMELSPGFVEPGWCTNAHVVHVIEGAFTLRLREHEVEMKVGDVAVLAPDPEHAHKASVGAGEHVRLLLFETRDPKGDGGAPGEPPGSGVAAR